MLNCRILSAALVLFSSAVRIVEGGDGIDFDRQVAPLIAERCLGCHSGTDPKGGFDFSRSKEARAGGDSGVAWVPGKTAASLLWKRISQNEMPPKHPLPDSEKETFRKWIDAGAKWGTDPIDPHRISSTTRAGVDWWSWQPLRRHTPLDVHDARYNKFIKNPIDSFIAEGLRKRKLSPNPSATRETLIRRWYFDLLGLPPSPAEVRRFVADSREDAEERVVQGLLSSPHYGERWGRHWLDVAHFGESDGFEYDRMRPHAWRYRDWVIQALNQDMPFTDFAQLQIAGDVLRPNDPSAMVATGFLVAGAFDGLLPAGDEMRQIMRQDELEDLVGIVGQTFLGVSIHCARCHDHKFDPIPQRDYYRLAAALGGVKRGDRKLATEPIPRHLAAHLQSLERQVDEIESPLRTTILSERAAKLPAGVSAPRPIASWNFNNDLRDEFGHLNGTAIGNVILDRHRLILDGGRTYVVTAPLREDLVEKTLQVWVRLDYLEQRGGGVIGVQTLDAKLIDVLVYGEQEAKRWEAASSLALTGQTFRGLAEGAAKDRTVCLSLVYDNTGRVTLYRDGTVYGSPLQRSKTLRFPAGKAQVLFGVRGLPAGSNKHLTGFLERANLYDRALTAAEVAHSTASPSQYVSTVEIESRLSPNSASQLSELRIRLTAAKEQAREYREAAAFAVTPQAAPVTHVLRRGNYKERGEVVSAGGLGILRDSGADFGLKAEATDSERRSRLANWVANEKNPLFARTIVNRIWHYHFGRGLVETPNDLGFNGGQPSHPELLDWLAAELIRRGWRLKELHRMIVLSGAYRQSAAARNDVLAVDADNRFLWRFSPQRLDAECLRDAVLSVSGELNPFAGGPGFQDFRPYFHRGAQFFEMLDLDGPEYNRRSIYRMWVRGGRNRLLDAFDSPDPSTTAPKRGSTTTPLQSLSLMNSSFMLRMSDRFAKRIRHEAGSDTDSQLRLGFELALGREPSPPELQAAREFLRQQNLEAFCRALLNSNGFLYVR